MFVSYQIPMILSSSTSDGAQDKSDDGSSFSITLDRPIEIPSHAKHCWVECQSSEVWNTVPNIITGVNDKLYFSTQPPATPQAGNHIITIPQGLYDVSELNLAIGRQIRKLTTFINDSIIFIIGDSATSKTILNVGSGVVVDFTQNDTFRDMLGFTSQTLDAIGGNSEFVSDNSAKFNTVNYFLIHSDIVNKGLRNNNRYLQTVSQVLIDKPAGSQILSAPFNVPKIPAQELIGDKRNKINIWLTDQNNNRVNTAGEDFSIRLVINYVIE